MTLKLLSLLISSFWLVQNLILPSTIFAVETCPPGENRYRPGGNCEKESPQPAHSKINDYPLSCIPSSNLTYTQTTNDPNQIPSQVTVTLNVDLTNAELGGFGPDSNTISTTSPDILSQKYPFNALFDKPPNTSPFNSRESFRTWWRLLSSLQQANAKAIYLTQADQNKINNITYEFYNSQDKLKQWEIKKLYNKLPNCLRKSPVCSDFLEKYQNLNTDTQEAYDALMPFNFDNLKTFLVLDNSVITENIPFLNAINTGVNDPNTGLIYTLSPSWTQTDITNNIILINNKGENQQLLIDKADNFNCPAIPKDKLTHLPAPKTFPTPTYLTQQVTFKDLTVTKEQTGTESECKGANYCIGLNQTTCNSYSACTWISKPKYQYTITGQGEGDPVVIFNHPFVKNIENSIVSGNTSLFKMLLPNFAQIPEERTIDAPKSTFTASSPYPNSSVSVTTSNGSSDMPIYRKTALIKDSLCQLQNMWLIPAGLQRNTDCSPEPTPTPPTSTGDICAIATAYNIPCCHLGGIWMTESGQSNELSGPCCSASGICGPMQIAGGRLQSLINGDPLSSCPASNETCLCTTPGAWELAARMLLVTKCVAAGKCNSFTWQPEFIDKYAIQPDEYDPVGYYEGNANGCIPSNYTQCRWGAGKSYCDNVELYCNSGQTLPDNCTQSYCSLVGITCP
ncbi:hypothetical protein KJ953_03315 [Patescibacteria group bacterium]|nr:hypothetical protein [Patescibacteria group bacterium]MBU1256632.1 hypothetical protein [Patescibacteria group bacterium]MBU1457136.1 hypothetical protein [Patescibacteria group bacterium]